MLKVLTRKQAVVQMHTYSLKNVPLPLNLWLGKKSFFLGCVRSDFCSKQWIRRLNIYMYVCMYFWLFIHQFSEMLLLRTAKAVSHLSYTISVTALHCVGRKIKTWDKEMLGWQLEFDLRGAFQAWEPKVVVLRSWCAKMVRVLSSSITRCTACAVPLRWYFPSERLS